MIYDPEADRGGTAFCTQNENEIYYGDVLVELINGVRLLFQYSYSRPAYIYLDINGTKGPNLLGIDLFIAHWEPQEQTLIRPIFYEHPVPATECKEDPLSCFRIIVHNGWKIPEGYSWDEIKKGNK